MFWRVPNRLMAGFMLVVSFVVFGGVSAQAQSEEELLSSIRFFTEQYEEACKRIDRFKKEQAELEAKMQAALDKEKPKIDAARAYRDAANQRVEEWQAVIDDPSSSDMQRYNARQAAAKWRNEASAETRYISRIEIRIRRQFNDDIYDYNRRIGDEERTKKEYAKELEDLRYRLKNPGGGPIIAAKPRNELPGEEPGSPADVSVPEGGGATASPAGQALQSIFNNFEPVFQIGGGINFPTGDRAFSDFNQGLDADPGGFAMGGIGLKSPLGRSANDFSYGLGVVVQHQQVDNRQLVNFNAPGTLPLGGESKATSIYGRFSVERPFFANASNGGLQLLKWEVSAGAGVAFQKFSATNGGATVLSGSATTPMLNFTGGFTYPVTENIDFGVTGYATWFDSYHVSTGTVSSRFAETWDLGVFGHLKFRLPRY